MPVHYPACALVQEGWFTNAQAQAALSTWVYRYCRSGSVWDERGGLFRIRGWPESWRGRAWYAVLTTHGVMSGPAALRAWEGAGDQYAEQLHVTVEPTSAVRSSPVLQVHRQVLGQGEIADIDGLPLTSPLRTATDCAVLLPLVHATVAIESLCRAGRLTVAEFTAACGSPPYAWGAAKQRAALQEVDLRSQSGPETEMRFLLLGDGLPYPEPQCFVGGMHVDLAYPHLRHAIEVDSKMWHSDDDRVQIDRDRAGRLTAHRWTYTSVTPRDIRRRPRRVMEQVHVDLERAARLIAG